MLFPVEPIETDEYIARAFFPSSADSEINVLVDDSVTSSGWPPSNILGHELGHTLGFRHEHTRPESGTCFEDNNWRPLTPYDSDSIMHYPQCNGTSATSASARSTGRAWPRSTAPDPPLVLTIRLRSDVFLRPRHRRRIVGQAMPAALSSSWSRSCAAISTALCRHSEAR